MKHVAVYRVLNFDRFGLDLARGNLRAGEQDIELRPKAFEVLKYLVENAGRLITKQELSEVVWPAVAVSDDSITQCIRELRNKLGDEQHSLIKTVSRRGYLLDAAVTAEAPEQPSTRVAALPSEPPQKPPAVSQPVVAGWAHRGPMFAGIATVLLGVAWWASYFLGWSVSFTNTGFVSYAKNAPGKFQPQPSFKDCADCPEMVALPAGEFMMGSPENERGHLDVEHLSRSHWRARAKRRHRAAHMAILDQPLYARARLRGQNDGEKLIEARAVVLGLDDEVVSLNAQCSTLNSARSGGAGPAGARFRRRSGRTPGEHDHHHDR